MGLLDNPQDAAMMQLGLGLLSAGGPSRMPVSFGQALGSAGNQAMDAYRQAQGDAFKRQMMEMQLKQAKQQMEDADKERAFFSDPSRFMVSPASQALANGQGPTTGNALAMSSMAPKFDAKAMYAEMLKSGSPALGRTAIEALSKQEAPKLKEIKNLSVGGKTTPVMVFENGSVKTMDGYDVPPEIVMQNLGNRVVAIDKNSLKGGENLSLGVSPDAQLQAGVTMRGQNMTDVRAKEANLKPQFSDGQWVYPPSANAPSGVAISPKGFTKPMNDTQAKAAGYADRMAAAENIMSDRRFSDGQKPEWLAQTFRSIPSMGLGGTIGNAVESSDRQQVRQAQEDWVRAALRLESGAVIGKDEMDQEIKTFFPQIGDSSEMVKQKAKARKLKQAVIAREGGPGYKPLESTVVDFSQLRK